MTEPRDVFLSSASADTLEFRLKIRSLDERRLWLAEVDRPDLNPALGLSPFTVLDALVEQIRQSTLFICVLRTQYGASVFKGMESVSFLETEIYQAALFHNNVHIVLVEPFNPDARLAGLLDLLRVLRPHVVPKRAVSEISAIDQIKRLLAARPQKRWRSHTLSVRALVGQLATTRGSPRADVRFFDGVFRPVAAKPDPHRVKALLENVAAEKSIERQLTRTWIALRELCSAPYDSSDHKEYLPLWNAALGEWSRAAAWYGLHGHLFAGRLAAVNSLLAIRSRMTPDSSDDTDHAYIHGTKGARQASITRLPS